MPKPSSRHRAVLSILLAALLAPTGCTSSGSATPTTSPAPASGTSRPGDTGSASAATASTGSGPATGSDLTTGSVVGQARRTTEVAWRSAGFAPVAPAVEAAGVLLVYGTVGSKLSLYALDPTDGTVVWTQPAGYGIQYVDADDALAVFTDEGRVGYLRPDKSEPRRSQLIIADARTGKDLIRSTAGYLTNDIWDCGSKSPGICITGYPVDHPDDLVSLQLDEKTGAFTDRAGGSTGGLEPMGSHDVYVGDPNDPRIIRRLNGKTVWVKKLSDYTDISRWHGKFSQIASDNMVMVTLTMSSPVAHGIRSRYPADAMTLGIDLSTGTLRWKDSGTVNACAGSVTARPGLLRCRLSGTVTDTTTTDPAALPSAVASDLKVSLEAYDPRTGKARWRTAVGNVPLLAVYGNQALVPDGQDTVLLARASKPLVIDLRTGRSTPAPADRVFWCPDNWTAPRSVPVASGGQLFTDVMTSGLVMPCNASGRASKGTIGELPVTAGVPMSDERGDLLVVTSHSAVTAYLLPDAPTTAGTAAGPATTATAGKPGTVGAAEPVGPPAAVPEQIAWKNTQLSPVTQVSLVDGIAVYYAQDVSNTLFLVALNPTTGQQLWHKWATTAELYPDRELTVGTYDNRVVYWKPAKDGFAATTMLVNPSNGHERAISDVREWSSVPESCPAQPRLLCSAAYIGDTWTELRIDPASGAVTEAPKATGSGEDDQPDSNGLLVTKTDVRRVIDGKALWSTSKQQVFGDPDASVQVTGSMDSDPAVFVFTAYRGWHPNAAGDYPSFDPAKNLVSVGIDADTGRVRWQNPGMSLLCFFRITETNLNGAGPSDTKVLACSHRGTLDDGDHRSGDLTRAVGARITLMRIDPTTGKPYWSRPLGSAPDLATPDGPSNVRYLDPQRVLLGTTGTVVDLNTGTTRKAGPTDVSWCSTDGTFTYRDPYHVHGEPQYYRTGGELLDPCRPDGTSAKPTMIPPDVGVASADGKITLVAERKGVFAYRTRRS
ncbi:RAD23 family protein [Nakamurella lactea]|uniref:PQQ-binding-like beta-propeller repeat protein n=1 Tax=Nakamurella lactea TaxID=459515 RepID=UPI0004170AB8|nr:PQQ-binding-like beta-propeller repeat protein [Nakamurella lactea]